MDVFIHCANRKLDQVLREYKWYTDDPPVNKLLLPVADPKKPWGDKECKDCKGFCSGHYLKPVEVLNNKHGQKFSQPPSVVIQNKLKQLQSSHVNVTELACSTLLPVEEVNIWIDHLTTLAENRKKGLRKQQKHTELNILLIMRFYIMYQIRMKVMMRMVIVESVVYFMKMKQMK